MLGGADPPAGLRRQAQGAAQHQRGPSRRRSRCSSTRTTRSRRSSSTTGSARCSPRPTCCSRTRSRDVAVNYEQLLPKAGEFRSLPRPDRPHPRAARSAEQILDSVAGAACRPAQRGQVAAGDRFARLARQNLGARRRAARLGPPADRGRQAGGLAASVPPLDTFAIAVAAAVTLLFVTVLLVAGSLALEREENTFTRLTRGLVSRDGAAGREGRRSGRSLRWSSRCCCSAGSRRSSRSTGAGST